ncbi:B-cell receptor CD22-like [Enoplosus armatus]|uniref:B-cell receptor CD22-like n=1 Tax=Enoplosus armatus TaxID=215367 RepID=UPI0039944BB2
MRGAAMSWIWRSGFVALLLTGPAVQSQNGWEVTYSSNQVCAFKGSTVDISCTYRHPLTINPVTIVDAFWFSEESNTVYVDLRTDPEYSGRVQYLCDVSRCTLRIKDLRESDSAEYRFRFITDQPDGRYTGSPGVTLTVTDVCPLFTYSGLQVQVSRLEVDQSYNWAELKCHGKCHLPGYLQYVWYKNEENLGGSTSDRYSANFGSADNFSCAVRGYEKLRSPAVSVLAGNGWQVTYSSTEICAFKGSTVDIRCTYRYPSINKNGHITVKDAFWFTKPPVKDSYLKLETDSGYTGRVEYNFQGNDCTLRITDLRESDAAEYKFRFITSQRDGRYTGKPGVTLTVTDAPELPSVSASPSDDLMEGSSVKLTCSCDANPAANYSWYKKNQTRLNNKPQLVFSSVRSSDSGEYYCAAENELGRRTSEYIFIDVRYAPKTSSASVSPSGEIVEGTSVTLTCSSDANPAANYTWYKENQTLLQGPEGKYYFTSISHQDSGYYNCKSENQYGQMNSSSLFIDVQYPPKPPSVSVSPSAEIVEGSSVNLTCSSDANPAANYTWYKENEDSPKASGQNFSITDIRAEHSGSYYCEAQNSRGRHNSTLHLTVNSVRYAPKPPSVSVSPSAEIVEGSSVNLTCSSDANPAANYTWYKGKKTLLNKKPQLVFSSIQSSDSGEYYCAAENELGRRTSEYASINVKYAPKTSSASVSPSAEIVEGSSVTLTCSSDANPAANYTWYKENKTLLQGPQGSYHFTSISSEDRGIYSCKSENQHGELGSKSVFIDVQYAPKPPSVSVSPSAEIVEGSSVNLSCSSDANPAANYTWYKENEDSPTASGQNFSITDIRAEHSGSYYCEAQNSRGRHSSTLHLIDVAGAWKSIAIGATAAVVLTVLLLSVFILIRSKKASKQSSEPGETRPDNRNQRQQEEQDGLHYASVQFFKNQADTVYSNIRSAGPHRPEDEDVEYSAVTFHVGSTAPR